MTKIRIFLLLTTVAIVGLVGLFASYYARGYRFDSKTLKFTPNGLLVINSDPTGAQIWLDGKLMSATNSTLPLSPGIYEVLLKKEGFLSWSKKVTIDKEIVTQVEASLFPSASSVSAITFSGAVNPQVSPDATKIAYEVSLDPKEPEKGGLWVLETVNLPLGFNRDPRRLTDADLKDSRWIWSPDSRQILLTTKLGNFILDTANFIPQSQLSDITNQIPEILQEWQNLKEQKINSLLAKLPPDLTLIFKEKTKEIEFSPDETKILYTGTLSANLPKGLIKALPGASTQEENRQIEKGKRYVFDIKEDKNFKIAEGNTSKIYWLATSRHLMIPEKDQIDVFDYDATNKVAVFTGSYIFPFAYPSANANRIFILTNLGAKDILPNLYSLNLK